MAGQAFDTGGVWSNTSTASWRLQQGNTSLSSEYYGTMTSSFYLSDDTTAAAIAPSYDFYRIKKIKYEIEPFASLSSQAEITTTNNTGGGAKMILVTDFDGQTLGTPPTASTGVWLSLKRRPGHKEFNLSNGKKHKIIFRPANSGILYAGLTTNAYYPIWKKWLDQNNLDTPYYGLTGIVCMYGGPSNWAIDIKTTVTYYVEFKSRLGS